jgi:hypothetical protein
MNVFVRDALGGGCSVAAPPDNLGFRLVLERPWFERLSGTILGVVEALRQWGPHRSDP